MLDDETEGRSLFRERALVFEINLIIEYPIGNFMNDDLSCPSCSLVLFIS